MKRFILAILFLAVGCYEAPREASGMPSSYTPNPLNDPATITLPAPGDLVAAAVAGQAWKDIADRTASRGSPTVVSITAMAALVAPSPGEKVYVQLLGTYMFAVGAPFTADGFFIVTGDGGQWVRSSREYRFSHTAIAAANYTTTSTTIHEFVNYDLGVLQAGYIVRPHWSVIAGSAADFEVSVWISDNDGFSYNMVSPSLSGTPNVPPRYDSTAHVRSVAVDFSHVFAGVNDHCRVSLRGLTTNGADLVGVSVSEGEFEVIRP